MLLTVFRGLYPSDLLAGFPLVAIFNADPYAALRIAGFVANQSAFASFHTCQGKQNMQLVL